jgi:hypothetical protein
MNLRARIERLEALVPPVPRRAVPLELDAFAEAFRAGRVGVADIDMTDYEQTQVFFAFAIRTLVAHREALRAAAT